MWRLCILCIYVDAQYADMFSRRHCMWRLCILCIYVDVQYADMYVFTSTLCVATVFDMCSQHVCTTEHIFHIPKYKYVCLYVRRTHVYLHVLSSRPHAGVAWSGRGSNGVPTA